MRKGHSLLGPVPSEHTDPRHLRSPHIPVFPVVSSPGSGSGQGRASQLSWGVGCGLSDWQDIKHSSLLTETGWARVALHASFPRQASRGCWSEPPRSPGAARSVAAWLTVASVPRNGPHPAAAASPKASSPSGGSPYPITKVQPQASIQDASEGPSYLPGTAGWLRLL